MRITALALTGALLVTLTACGGDGEVSVSGASSTGASSSSVSTSAPAGTSSTSTESGGTESAGAATSSTASPSSSEADAGTTGTPGTAPAGFTTVTAKNKTFTVAVPKDTADVLAQADAGATKGKVEVARREPTAATYQLMVMAVPQGATTLETFARQEACQGVATGFGGTHTPAPDISLDGEQAKGCVITGKKAGRDFIGRSYAVFKEGKAYLGIVMEEKSVIAAKGSQAPATFGSWKWSA